MGTLLGSEGFAWLVGEHRRDHLERRMFEAAATSMVLKLKQSR
jgi:hypothetical protein